MALTLRTIKGSRLTHEELDGNFRHLTGSHEVSGSITAVTYYGDGSNLTGIVASTDLTGTTVISGSTQIAELNAGIISGSAQLPAGIISGSVQLDGEVFGFTSEIVASGSFSGSFVGDGSGLTGISAGGSLEGSAGFYTVVDYATDPSLLKRDNLVVYSSDVSISVPPATDFALGTVVEFDIYIPTGSNWTLVCKDTAGSLVNGFKVHGNKGFDQLDFNPQFASAGASFIKWGWPGYELSAASGFGDLLGDTYHPGPALVRLVAVKSIFNFGSPTYPGSGEMGGVWAVRLIGRQPISNSPGTGLSVEIVSALPTGVGINAPGTGDLVLYDPGFGLKLHAYDGTNWQEL